VEIDSYCGELMEVMAHFAWTKYECEEYLSLSSSCRRDVRRLFNTSTHIKQSGGKADTLPRSYLLNINR